MSIFRMWYGGLKGDIGAVGGGGEVSLNIK